MMKKKVLASLLVGSAVVCASLAPLSAQAVTTGNTPVTVGFEGGSLPDHGSNDGGNVDPDPTKPNTDFDLLAIPKNFDFPLVKIGEDLSAIMENTSLNPSSPSGASLYKAIMVGDVRGTKEGWHVTGEISELSNGKDKLAGEISFGLEGFYAVYNNSVNHYESLTILNAKNISNDPTAPSFVGTNIKIGSGASTLMTASVGKGQGSWSGVFRDISLNVTTPSQELRKGSYTGNIIWNLVSGPSI